MISKNRIKQIRGLHAKKNRDDEGLFLVEGMKPVKELLQQKPGCVEEVFATDLFIKENSGLTDSLGAKLNEITQEELKLISAQSSPNNVLAICGYFEESDPDFDFEKGFSFYLDEIRDPGNFGTIIRLANWYGISKIFCSSNSCELYNPKVIQSTMGAFMRVKVVYCKLADLIERNKISNVYGAVLNGKNIYESKLMNGIIVIGNEANGISKESLSLITHPVTIPAHQNTGAESLNAAMAASIITSEFFRQLQNN